MAELRCEISDSILAVVDAQSSAHGGVGRKQIVEEVLLIWAKEKHREATLVLRVAGVDPTWPDTYRK
jgi:hypothetical protein